MNGLYVARHHHAVGGQGMVDHLYDALEAHEATTAGTLEGATLAPVADGPRLVFTQTEGGLSSEHEKWAIRVLAQGSTILELNTFALASRFRPRHPRYRMILLSRDGAARYRIRSASTPGQPVKSAAVIGYPLLKELSRGGDELRKELTDGRPGPVLARVGRPDPRKWTGFEIEVANIIARRSPGTTVHLVLVGAPGTPRTTIEPNVSLRVLPYLDDVGRIYRAADVYLHHSRIGETYGMTLYEAAATGARVVVGLDPDWDAAPLEFLGPEHVVATRARVLELARTGRIPMQRVMEPLTPKSLDSYVTELLALGRGGYGLTPVPSVREAADHILDEVDQLGGDRGQVAGTLAKESLRSLRRWVAASISR